MKESKHSLSPQSSSIPALVPSNEAGHHFICYADCCSGIPAAPNEATFAAVNGMVSRLRPQPDFICFLGDEINEFVGDVLPRQAHHLLVWVLWLTSYRLIWVPLNLFLKPTSWPL